MSAEGIRLALNKIVDDILAVCHLVLEDDTVSTNDKVGRNTLKDSALNGDLYATIGNSLGEDPVITAYFNNYVVFLEWDRPPKYKKQPPIDVLKDWAAKNGIPTDAETLWRISYAIWRDGHKGRPIFATIDREIDKLYTDDWADQLHETMLTDINQHFND